MINKSNNLNMKLQKTKTKGQIIKMDDSDISDQPLSPKGTDGAVLSNNLDENIGIFSEKTNRMYSNRDVENGDKPI